MTYFPVSSSNLSATHLGLFLEEKYPLCENTKCTLLRAGINDTYLVYDDQQKYVFRVYSLNWRTKKEILEELRLLNELKQNNISISYPYADKENNYIQTLNAPEGERFGVLFSYAHGRKIHNYSAENHFQVGQIMGRLHNITNKLQLNRVTYTSDILLENSLEQIKNFLPSGTEELQFLESVQKYLLKALSEIDETQMRKGAVHLDIWFDNLNITNDNIVTIFDFDFCGNGYLCLDIAYYILQLHNIERYEENVYRPKINSFLEGYESITTLSDEERRLIPVLGVSLYFFYLGIQCQRYDNWSNTFLSEDYLKRYINGIVKRYYTISMLGEK